MLRSEAHHAVLEVTCKQDTWIVRLSAKDDLRPVMRFQSERQAREAEARLRSQLQEQGVRVLQVN